MEYQRRQKLKLKSTTNLYSAIKSEDSEALEKCVCLSDSSSVRPSNAWIVTKRKKDLSRFLA